jgi:hypothetical protein
MWDKLLELDLFNEYKIVGHKNATPAQILAGRWNRTMEYDSDVP